MEVNIDEIKNDLVSLNKEITKAEREKSEAIGAKRNLLDTLKRDFGHTSIAKAEAELDEINDDIQFEKEKLQEIYEQIKKDFQW